MPIHLSIPQHRRDRATTEKARSLRAGELRWVRVYTDDLDELADEAIAVRWLDDVLVRLASRRGWTIPYDPIRIARRLSVRPRDVRPALERLLTLGRLELVEVAEQLSTGGNVQIGLQIEPEPGPGDGAAVAPQGSHGGPTVAPLWRRSGEVVDRVSAQIQASLESSGPSQGPQTRQEQEQKRESSTSNGTVTRNAARAPAPNPQHAPDYAAAADADQRDIVNRLIGLVARGRPTSIAVLRYECVGLPDAAIARTIESVQCRQPRPSNPAGYAVGALQALRVELGIRDTRPRIDREPTLGEPR